MSLNWEKVKLGDISSMQYGYGASAKMEEIGPKFLRITDIVPDLIDWSTVPFCEISDADYDKYKVKKGDILVARTGATAGYAKLIRNDVDAVFAGYLIRITPNENCSKQFLGRLIESSIFKDFVDKVKGGAAQPQANAPVLKEFEFNLPELDIQQKIASILSTYDKLIENNTRRIEILEEMAQRIYKEWFVDFKYPGYENDELEDSELGMIPKDWEVGRVSDLYEVKSGFAFKSKKMQDSGDFGIVKIKNIQSAGIDLSEVQYILQEDVEPRAYNFELEENDLLIAMTGAQVGKVGLMPKTKGDYFLNQRVGKFFPLPHFKTNNTFLNQLSRSKYFQSSVVNIAQGAAQPNISGKQIANIQFPLPNLKMISEYEQLCESFKNQITNLNFANVNLKETRDYLLPKLISGKVDVSVLDIDTDILDD